MKKAISMTSQKEFDEAKEKAKLHLPEAKKLLEQLIRKAGFRVFEDGWHRNDDLDTEVIVFDYIIPNGHIEFVIRFDSLSTGWGQVENTTKEASA